MSPPGSLKQDRIAQAEAFLRETVFRSREKQSAAAAIRAPATGSPNCGLGERAAVEIDVSPRARELLLQIHPGHDQLVPGHRDAQGTDAGRPREGRVGVARERRTRASSVPAGRRLWPGVRDSIAAEALRPNLTLRGKVYGGGMIRARVKAPSSTGC